MVKNRGIDIAIVSQLDIRCLPEILHSGLEDHNGSNTVSCSVPVYPGSQIWFEYTIEPPQPPQAAYFFKLFVNGTAITAWDCTEKHLYHGKMVYFLEQVDNCQGQPRTWYQRKGFKFSDSATLASERDENTNCIEIKVYRIEHRRRIYGAVSICDDGAGKYCGSQLQLIDGGMLEPGQPQRRYQYQLLDPVDEPYAVFRFNCCTYEHSKKNTGIKNTESAISSSPLSSMFWHNHDLELSCGEAGRELDCREQMHQTGSRQTQHFEGIAHKPFNISEEPLSVVAVEDSDTSPITNVRSFDPKCSATSNTGGNHHSTKLPTKLTLSPRQKLKKRLTLNIEGSVFDTSKSKRPLSPFTSGGLLRRTASPVPTPWTPTAITPFFSPLCEGSPESIEVRMAAPICDDFASTSSPIPHERDGKLFTGFLGRRLSRKM